MGNHRTKIWGPDPSVHKSLLPRTCLRVSFFLDFFFEEGAVQGQSNHQILPRATTIYHSNTDTIKIIHQALCMWHKEGRLDNMTEKS